jgi:hypothetical protein
VRSAVATVVCALLVGCGGELPEDVRDPRTPPAAASDVHMAASGGAAAPPRSPADAASPPAQASGGAAAFDSARAWEHLRHQVGLGPRPSGSAALEACRRYIIDQLQAAGIGTRQQAFIARTPAGDVPMINVVATIPGRRRERIILATHIDTKRAPFRFVGANDGASSTAALLELGRALHGSQPEYTIELLFLDGEEAVNWDWGVTGVDNTYGSRHYVEEARGTGTLEGIAALVLLDMIGEPNPRFLRDEYSTRWLVDIIWRAADRLGHGAVFVDETTTVEDDHVPFVRAGVPAIDIIDIDYPQWHTADDDLEHVSARSLQIVGDAVLAALPEIERYAAANPRTP